MVIYEQVYSLVVAAATQVSNDDVALRMILNDFIGYQGKPDYGFYGYQRLNQNRSMLDNLIDYLRFAFPNDPDANAAAQELSLPEKKVKVSRVFLQRTYAENITSFITRDTIVEVIRNILRRENKFPNMNRLINSNRIDPIIHAFAETFMKYSVYAFAREQSLAKYVGNTFQTHFYPNRTKDIWDIIRAPDQARNSLEFSATEVKELVQTSTDDLPINRHIKNIQKANSVLFRHSGRDDDNHGILYDIFYLIMIQLGRKEVEAINVRLNGAPPAKGTSRDYHPAYTVKLVDMKNRSESTPAARSTNPFLYDQELYERKQQELSDGKNPYFFARAEVISGEGRGISSKINNAIDLIPVLFDRVREQSFSLSQLTMLRTEMFHKELRSTDGKQSIWIHDKEKQANRYLNVDTSDALTNYERFDIILKGVMSVYTLISEIEARGISLPEFYRGELFINTNVTRYVDYLSAVKSLDLIIDLQERVTNRDGGGILHDFNGMIYNYIGSLQNGHDIFRMAREYVDQEGFNGHPRLKTNVPELRRIQFKKTPFENLNQIHNVLSAIPYSCRDISAVVGSTLQPKSVDLNTYNEVHTNYFVFNAPRASNYIAKEIIRNNGHEYVVDIHDPAWKLGYSYFDGISIQAMDRQGNSSQQGFLLKLPYDNCLFLYDYQGDIKDALTNLMSVYNANYTTQQTLSTDTTVNMFTWYQAGVSKLQPIKCLTSPDGVPLFSESIKFPFLSGLRGIYRPENIAALNLEANIPRDHRKHVQEFIEEWGSICELQDDVRSFLQDLVAQCIFGSHINCPTTVGHADLMNAYKSVLQNGLMRGSFDAESLNLVLNHLASRLTASRSEIKPTYEKYRTEYARSMSALENARACGKDCTQYEQTYNYYAGAMVQMNELVQEPKSAAVLHFVLKGKTDGYSHLPRYKDLLEPLLEFEDPAVRFVMLLNLIYTEMNMLKVIRDAYYMVAGITKTSLASLSCELDIQFSISKTLAFSENPDSYAIMVDKLSLSDTRIELRRIMNMVKETYQIFIDDILSYLRDCSNDLAGLLDYSIQSKQVQSKLEEFGQAFMMRPAYPEIVTFKKFRDDCDKDSAGFLMRGNKYFYGMHEGLPCYVHATGRLLWVRSSHDLRPLEFEFSIPEDPEWANLTAEQRKAKEASLSAEELADHQERERARKQKELDEREKYWNILKGSLPNGYT